MREVFLVGVGATGFGRSGRTEEELGREAVAAALADAGLAASDVAAASLSAGAGAAQRTGLPDLGLGTARVAQVGRPTAWASRAMQMAWQAVAGGEYDVVLCAGIGTLAGNPESNGTLLHAQAAAAQHYMDASGATEEHLARVAAKNRTLGADNPRATLAARVDTGDVLGSEMLEWPLRRLMVAAHADGAAAVVFTSGSVRRRLGGHAARVRASVLLGDSDAGAAISRAALARPTRAPSLGPEEIDLAEVDDPTPVDEIAAYEALQFAPQGQGPELVESAFTALGGVLPVNTSGGLLSQGEAIGASGIAQVCEISWQLRGPAGRAPGVGRPRGAGAQRAPRTGPPAARLADDPQRSLTPRSRRAFGNRTTPVRPPPPRARGRVRRWAAMTGVLNTETQTLPELLRTRAAGARRRALRPRRSRGLDLRRVPPPGDRGRRRPARARAWSSGDVVGVVLRNGPEYLEVWWAILWLGAIFNPVNPVLTPREAVGILADSEAQARRLRRPRSRAGLRRRIASELPALREIIAVDGTPTIRSRPCAATAPSPTTPRRRARRPRLLRLHLRHHRAGPRARCSATRNFIAEHLAAGRAAAGGPRRHARHGAAAVPRQRPGGDDDHAAALGAQVAMWERFSASTFWADGRRASSR